MSYGADDWSDAGHHDFEYEVEQIDDGLSRKLRNHFALWVRTLPMPRPGTFAPVRCIDPSAHFLSFNYTPTLQSIYGVPRSNVLHIHGETTDSNDLIVLGHGWERLPEEMLSGRVDEDTDTHGAGGYDIIDGYFASTFKPTETIIERNAGFFASLGDVGRVMVLGHSLSEVDAPYLSDIMSAVRSDAVWTVSYRNTPSSEFARMRALGIDHTRICCVPLAHL